MNAPKHIAQFFTLKTSIILGCLVFLYLNGCKSDPKIQPNNDIKFTIPPNWSTPFYSFQNNTLTEAGFELGRKLFYDPRLSSDNTISCGSCHQQFAGFANKDHNLSHGVNSLLGNRNSPALFNLAWHTSFFWDGGVNNLENQPINPIQNPVEMNENMPHILTKIGADPDYQNRFTAAFGDPTMNYQRIMKALSQFMGAIVSSNAPFDQYKRQEKGSVLTSSELTGYQLYQQKCAACHTEPLFSDFSFRNNGLPPSNIKDSGRMHITKDINDFYKFKVPSLRNLKYTAPYMHDGRFNTLDQVLDHYANNIHPSPNLDPLLTNGIQFSNSEKTDLLNFLNTLNDESLVHDTRFAEVK